MTSDDLEELIALLMNGERSEIRKKVRWIVLYGSSMERAAVISIGEKHLTNKELIYLSKLSPMYKSFAEKALLKRAIKDFVE